MPDLDAAGQCQEGQEKGLDHLDDLHGDDNFPLIHALDEHTGRQGKDQCRQGG